jgi:hypothetical protein
LKNYKGPSGADHHPVSGLHVTGLLSSPGPQPCLREITLNPLQL